MVALSLPQVGHAAPKAQEFTARDLALLNHLRFVTMGCRAKARTDLFEACALLSVDRTSSSEAFSVALMRCLGQALGQRPRLLQPGSSEISFDEAWLLQLARATKRGDESSIAFLLASRVPHHLRRHIRFLVARISESFALD